jgi:hypothetical protein
MRSCDCIANILALEEATEWAVAVIEGSEAAAPLFLPSVFALSHFPPAPLHLPETSCSPVSSEPPPTSGPTASWAD